MKKLTTVLLTIIFVLTFCACGSNTNSKSGKSTDADVNTDISTDSDETTETATPVTDDSVTASETTSSFSIESSDGKYSTDSGNYTITTAGTYSFTGAVNGQILVKAGENDEVILELNGTTITYDKDSPIKILSAGKVEISAKSGTENVINDKRSAKTADNADQGEGAIYAKCDLKLKGTGTLVVNASYNNGIHTTKDLTIQKLSLKSNTFNNAIKGNDSVTVTSGTVVAISTNGNGIKTENTDTNKNGVTRGNISVTGGSLTVYAAGDGIEAAHNFEMSTGEEGVAPSVTVYTGSYSGYTASGASTSSFKGIKVQNELNVKSGSINLKTYDDGLHADYGTQFDDGTKGKGTINISGGTLSINVYAPENKTPGGRMGPGGPGGQQTVSGADGIHADYTLNVSGGTIKIDSAYEGLEANVINVSGGKTYVAANDDGVNACKGNTTPQIKVTGGYLDVAVSPNGDTDGIDSNGTYSQTGGVVIARGPNNQNMAAIDADSSVSISGGTLVVLGYGRVSAGSSVKNYSLSLHSSGSHTIKVGGTSYTFTNSFTYGRTTVYSSVSVSA
ncbi:MAG: carbohydrate-binding domain-containing protein [Clostridia bacterium]|nr:carbohydrate-binding domain-containing protein [Clostridia bacterium]